MVYSSSASQRRPCKERECQPRLHQVTTCRRHWMPYGDRSAIHHCHKNFIEPPATLVQQSWSPGRSYHSNTWQRAAALIQKLRVPLLTCTSMNKCQVCCLQTATTTHGEGPAPAAPSLHTTLVSSHHLSSPSGIQKTEDRRLKVQDHCSLAASFLPYALVIFVSLLFGFLYLYTACVLFRKTM